MTPTLLGIWDTPMQRTHPCSNSRLACAAFKSSKAVSTRSTRRQFRQTPDSGASHTTSSACDQLAPSETLKQQVNCRQQKQPLHAAIPNQQTYSSPQHPLLPHQPLKYAQMGHSSFSRGAPHVCYWHLNGSGVFYLKPDGEELMAGWKHWWTDQQHQWKQLMSHTGSEQHPQGAYDATDSSNSGSVLQDHQQQQRAHMYSRFLHSIQTATGAALAATSSSYKSFLAHFEGSGVNALRALLFVAAAMACIWLAITLGRFMVESMFLCYSGLMLR